MDTPTPLQVAESPWVDPWDGLLSGTYHVRLPGQWPDGPDHLLVYIRGASGDPAREYVGTATVCGRDLAGATRPRRVGTACGPCLDGAGRAFGAARLALADDGAGRLE